MSVFTAVFLGAVQGLTEFLPVSSSGHLVLFQKIFGISESALFFDTMVHVGTLAAVFTVLRKDIWAILRRIVQPLTAYLILATLPAVLVALVFRDSIEQAFTSGSFLGFAFLVTAALLTASELLARRGAAIACVTGGSAGGSGNGGAGGNADDSGRGDKDAAGTRGRKTMNWPDALIIGLLQGAAIIPGVSRSGATLSGALSRRLDRDFAARFSFLLSIPAILGALVLQVKDLAEGAAGQAAAAGGIGAGAIAAGTLSAAVVGFFAVRLMLKIVREKSLFGFAVYTAALGILTLVDQAWTHLVF